MRKLLFLTLLAPVLASAQTSTQLFAAWSPQAKTFSELVSTQVSSVPMFLNTRKTLRIGADAGLGASAALTGGFDVSTEWHVGTATNLVIGLIGNWTSGQKPTFGGIEIGVRFSL